MDRLPALSDGDSEHVISIGNPILGVFKYLVLPLPSGWVVQRSEVPPELTYHGEYNGVGYVVEGQAHHYATNLVSDESFQLTIRCKRGKALTVIKPGGLEKPTAGTTYVSGHTCFYAFGDKPVGLLKKDRMQHLKLAFNCDKTGRTIELELLGRSSEETLRQIIRTLEQARCHS